MTFSVLCREKYWSKEFADGVTFTGDPVVAIPDVSEVTCGVHMGLATCG